MLIYPNNTKKQDFSRTAENKIKKENRMLFICKKCKDTTNVSRVKTIVRDGKVISNIICDKCNSEMIYIKEHTGYASSGVFKRSSNF